LLAALNLAAASREGMVVALIFKRALFLPIDCPSPFAQGRSDRKPLKVTRSIRPLSLGVLSAFSSLSSSGGLLGDLFLLFFFLGLDLVPLLLSLDGDLKRSLQHTVIYHALYLSYILTWWFLLL
jgi:hypothetical protein